MNYSIQESERKRRASIFPKLERGFTLKQHGRSGHLYYRTEDLMLEFYTEMSGVPEYHYLIWEDGMKNWVYPISKPTTSEEQKRISTELVSWLKAQGHKTDWKD
jgi:hypothetical protein